MLFVGAELEVFVDEIRYLNIFYYKKKKIALSNCGFFIVIKIKRKQKICL